MDNYQKDSLVTIKITVYRNGDIAQDIETHDNSFHDVAIGFKAIRDEFDRALKESFNCPYHPSKGISGETKILRKN